MEARSPEKLMNVSNVKVSDEEWFLFRNMTIKANTKIVKQRFGINRVASGMVFQSVSRTLALRSPYLHLEFYQRDVVDGKQSRTERPDIRLRLRCAKTACAGSEAFTARGRGEWCRDTPPKFCCFFSSSFPHRCT